LNIDSYSIFTRLRSHFSQLLNVHGVNDVRQTRIHTTESLVPEPSALEMVVEKIKRHKLPGIDQILAELIKAGGSIFRPEIHKLINSNWTRRSCLRSGRNRSLCLFIKR